MGLDKEAQSDAEITTRPSLISATLDRMAQSGFLPRSASWLSIGRAAVHQQGEEDEEGDPAEQGTSTKSRLPGGGKVSGKSGSSVQ